jgi:hypothetical protein
MFGFFLSAIFWAFRPGSSAIYAEVSSIPLRDDRDLPDSDGCGGDCATCSCASSLAALKGFPHD